MSKDQPLDIDNFQREDPLGDDGFEEVQCAIPQTHPGHLWNKPGEDAKMCPGKS